MSRRIAAASLAAFAVVGGAACSDSDREQLGDTLDSVVDDVQDAADSLVSTVQQGASDAINDTAEAAVRNLAAQFGKGAFESAGQPIEGDLTCEATVTQDASHVDVTCTGTTTQDGAAELTGQTSELPGAGANALTGDFTGTVDGAEVFTTDTLGG
jgi:hypothetical protein